jgi:hypothetical protein
MGVNLAGMDKPARWVAQPADKQEWVEKPFVKHISQRASTYF